MVALKKFDISGKEVGEVIVDEGFASYRAHAQMVKDRGHYEIEKAIQGNRWGAR